MPVETVKIQKVEVPIDRPVLQKVVVERVIEKEVPKIVERQVIVEKEVSLMLYFCAPSPL